MNIIERVQKILFSPKEEWQSIEQETTPVAQLVTTYLIPLALIPAICSFIGYGLIGYSTILGHIGGTMTFGIVRAVLAFLSPVLGAFLSALVISLLAPSFGSLKDFGKAMQLVVYSFTPMLVAGVFYILPSLGFIAALAGIYGLYIMYLGFTPLLKTPADKLVSYFVVSLIAIIVVYVVIGLILWAITAPFLITGAMMVH